MIFICIYVTIISLFHREFLHPLEIKINNDSEGFESHEQISKLQLSGISIRNDSEEVKDRESWKYQISETRTENSSDEVKDLKEMMQSGSPQIRNDINSGEIEHIQRIPKSVSSPIQRESVEEDYVLTVISIFFLWISALTLGKLSKYVSLPPLLGMLIAGILFGNVPGMKNFLIINKFWEEALRKMAFLLILVRAGVGIDPEVLKRSLVGI